MIETRVHLYCVDIYRFPFYTIVWDSFYTMGLGTELHRIIPCGGVGQGGDFLGFTHDDYSGMMGRNI